MAQVYVDADISGAGSVDFSSINNQVWFVSFDMTTAPIRATHSSDAVADRWNALGYFSLGDSFDAGPGTAEHWRDLEWWNFTNNLWTPNPSTDPSGSPLAMLATRIRYFIYGGGAGHLHVFGA